MNIVTRMPSEGAGKPAALLPDAGCVMTLLPFGGIGGRSRIKRGSE